MKRAAKHTYEPAGERPTAFIAAGQLAMG